ncbi:cellulose biosynthesis protein BcsF [Pseudomonas psychrophila]|uniref:cellulose biosynthesis protein BcsF n=1 Tax=Pseudomonas psychrophila TaxID=122355 RepID=UPI0003762B88|nr:cellulose biosynthesis protein BcsF [Pseudomonas psychrophila]
MTFLELVQLIGLTCVVSVLLTLFSQRIRLLFNAHFEQYLAPRYLKSRGVRRRAPASPSTRAPDEPV